MIIDLRSDVLTRPTEEMWAAMQRAEIGWSLYQQDRAVNELEDRVATLLGKQAGLFLPTCSAANMVALLTLGKRGSQIVCETNSHIGTSEAAGISRFAELRLHLVAGHRGIMRSKDVVEAIRGSRRAVERSAPVSVVCMENSHNNAGGIAVSAAQTKRIAAVAQEHTVAVYLDGARLFNSAAALSVSPKALVQMVDAVTVSLNKGLGAIMGAVLCADSPTIHYARLNARLLGIASLHKAGYFAAGALVALNNMADTFVRDNRLTQRLARKLSNWITVDLTTVQTNMVYADVSRLNLSAIQFALALETHGVRVNARTGATVRFVINRSISEADVDHTVQIISNIAS